MRKIYTFSIQILWNLFSIGKIFSNKIKLFYRGREETLLILKQKISSADTPFWIHVASLGEFEQGLPIIQGLKEKYPETKVVVSFFSPSGYEIKKNTPFADAVVYLPIDLPKFIIPFLDVLNPRAAIFVKYEFWHNTLKEISQRNIPLFLVSGIFRPEQLFFKSYGSFFRQSLGYFTHIFVQNQKSLTLLHSIGINKVSLGGDTRFDRVLQILERDNTLSFIQEFKDNKHCIVFGSSWFDDEIIYMPFINQSLSDIKFIIAPHHTDKTRIEQIIKQLQKKYVLYSELTDRTKLKESQVLIIDTIGLLTKIYSYADIAYVGGAMRTGLHNILEPAVFAIPVIIGKNYNKFNEAIELVSQSGVISISKKEDFNRQINRLLSNPILCKDLGQINFQYIVKNKGATQKLLKMF